MSNVCRDGQRQLRQIWNSIILRKLNFTFSGTGPAHLYTPFHSHARMARTASQCVSADNAHAVPSTQIMLARGFVQVSAGSFERSEVRFFRRKFHFSFFETGLALLHSPRHGQAPIRPCHRPAMPLLHVATYSTESVMTQYFQYTVYNEAAEC